MEIKVKKDKFLSGLVYKYKKEGKDSDALKPSTKKTVGSMLGDFTKMPEKLYVTGQIGSTSVRKSKPQENDLHGSNGTQMIPNGN